MRRIILFSVLSLILGIGLGMASFVVLDRFVLPADPSSAQETPSPGPSVSPSPQLQNTQPDNAALTERAYHVLEAMSTQDWEGLSACVSPERGVTFTPYSYVSEDDVCLTPAQIAQAGSDNTLYTWGAADGSGEPIQLNVRDYFANYVLDADFTQAPILGIDYVISSGNSLENVEDAYPDCSFVEFYYPGIDEALQGFDWCGLKLIFTQEAGEWYLVGVIHSQWTI